MHHALNLVQVLNGLTWSALVLSVSGSVWRWCCRQSRLPFDPLWSLIWVLALIHLGYIWRWTQGFSPDPKVDADMISLLGLRVIATMLGFGLFRQRMLIEGWRW